MTTTRAPETASPPEHRRLTLSQILELMLTRSGGDSSRVTLTRNSRGETQIEVLVRTGDDDDIRTAHDAARRARSIYDELRSAYPMNDGTTGGAS